MPKPKPLLKIVFVVFLSLFLMSWGYQGHYKISSKAAQSFTPEMEQFMAWSVVLAEHASDADARKDIDPGEEVRHYIDIDNYPGFLAGGRIPQTYDSVVALYGEAFVIGQGVLPWATIRTYDSLVASFARFDWEKAVLFASDLGHYIADAHQPLHITRNYNGQYTNNYDIHSRYETVMINAFNSQIDYPGDGISLVGNVNDYIFSYIYSNYKYVDSIMLADTYAEALAGNHSSYTYKAALWEKTGNFTIGLFRNASRSLAELIYSAWVDAGKPDMNSGPGIFEKFGQNSNLKLKVRPNPLRESGRINFELPATMDVCILLLDSQGMLVDKLMDETKEAGPVELSFNLSGLPDGIYYIILSSGDLYRCQKVIKSN
jgi:hypothetical protein